MGVQFPDLETLESVANAKRLKTIFFNKPFRFE